MGSETTVAIDPLTKLTPKQRAFVVAYVGKANGNATRAAREAGYSKPHPEGFRLLQNATVKAAINHLYKQTSMTTEEIVGRLEAFARADFSEVMTPVYKQVQMVIDDPMTGRPTRLKEWVDTDELIGYRIDSRLLVETGLMSVVKAVKETRFGTVYEIEDRQTALDKIARAKGIYREDGAVAEVVVKIVRGVDMEGV